MEEVKDDKNYVNLKLDSVFKSFFSDKKNEPLLIDFLSSVLDIPKEEIGNVHVNSNEPSVESVNDKFSRLDLNLSIYGKNVNIEMQVEYEDAYRERAVYYWAKLYTGLKKGENYADIPETIAIHILNYRLFDCNEYQSSFRFYEEKRHELLTHKCAIHFFELPKTSSELSLDNKKELWLNLIKADSNERYDEIAEIGSDVMSEAVRVIYDMRSDKKVREDARVRQKSLYDKYSAFSLAEKRGRAEGEKIGLSKGRAEGEKIGLSKGRAEGEKIGLSKGRAEGVVNSELNFMRLVGLLTTEGRMDELSKISTDKDKLQNLYKEFNII